MIIASTQFDLKPLLQKEEFWQRAERLLANAATAKADAIVFPEYFSLGLFLIDSRQSFLDSLLHAPAIEKEFIEAWQALVEKYGVAVIAGTIPVLSTESKLINRAYIFRKNLPPIFQDKYFMTRFENEVWKIHTGTPQIQPFRLNNTLCAVAICYDVEFPYYCEVAAKAQVEVLFVPSCTDDIHGYWRVRHCTEARAIEHQCFVAMSSVVGGNSNFPEIEMHTGKAAILSPCDIGFPDGGILAEGKWNQEGICLAKLDLTLLKKIRTNGTVLNLRDSQGKLEKLELASIQ